MVAAAFAGRRGRRDASTLARRQSRCSTSAIALIVIGLGIAIPAVVDRRQRRRRRDAGRRRRRPHRRAGRTAAQLFATNCANCHTLRASNAVGKVGPNLDVLRPPAALVENAVLQGRAQGRGNMPAGLSTGEDAKDVAAYVAAVAGRSQP